MKTAESGVNEGMPSGITVGSIVLIRYLDHVLFKDADPCTYGPFTREAVGWLDHEGDDCIRVIFERFAEPDPQGEARQRATGLVILKSNIIELKRVGANE